MKKGLMLLVAGLMAFGATVSAMASARLDSMSTDAREVEDMDLIWLYPNKVLEYKNTVDFRLNSDNYGDYGNGTDEWGGVIADESALGGVLGVYVNRPNELHTASHDTVDSMDFARDPIRYTWTGVGGDYHFEFNNILDLFWAQNVGGADLGVHVNYGNNHGTGIFWDDDSMGLGVGLGLGAVGPFSQLNIHADYDAGHMTRHDPTPVHDNGIYSIKLGALGQADLSTDNYARVFADLSLNQDNRTDWDGYNFSDFTALVGASCNHKVNGGKGLVSTGLIADYVGSSEKGSGITEDIWNLVWTGSVESEVSSWLTLRAGIQKAIVSRDYFSDPAQYFDSANDNVKFSTGFGITWENFTLDGDVDVASLENSIADVAPGNGIFFSNPTGTNDGNMFFVTSADLRYKF